MWGKGRENGFNKANMISVDGLTVAALTEACFSWKKCTLAFREDGRSDDKKYLGPPLSLGSRDGRCWAVGQDQSQHGAPETSQENLSIVSLHLQSPEQSVCSMYGFSTKFFLYSAGLSCWKPLDDPIGFSICLQRKILSSAWWERWGGDAESRIKLSANILSHRAAECFNLGPGGMAGVDPSPEANHTGIVTPPISGFGDIMWENARATFSTQFKESKITEALKAADSCSRADPWQP